MRFCDYFRLSFANIFGHKKRTLTTIVIISLLFSIVIAACLLISGLESAVINTSTSVTNGQVLLLTTFDSSLYESEQDFQANLESNISAIKSTIEQYGGTVVESTTYSTPAGTFYQVPPAVFSNHILPDDIDITPLADAPRVLISAATARSWLNINLPSNISTQRKLDILSEVYDQSIDKTINYNSLIGASPEEQAKRGTNFFVSNLLPASFTANSLELSNVDQGKNPFNLIFAPINTGSSLDFILTLPKNQSLQSKFAISEYSSGDIFALFPDLESAAAYSHNKRVACSESDRYFHECDKSYLAFVTPAFGDPLAYPSTFKEMWRIIRIFLWVFSVIALIISLTTFIRLITNDRKTISLYYALNSSRLDILKIYCVYLLTIALLSILFALILAVTFITAINLINASTFSQIFTLSYGLDPHFPPQIFLCSWTPEILIPICCVLIAVPASLILSLPAFARKHLAQNLK